MCLAISLFEKLPRTKRDLASQSPRTGFDKRASETVSQSFLPLHRDVFSLSFVTQQKR